MVPIPTQSQIIGAVLALTGIAVLETSVRFFRFSNKQLISVDAFEENYKDVISIISMDTTPTELFFFDGTSEFESDFLFYETIKINSTDPDHIVSLDHRLQSDPDAIHLYDPDKRTILCTVPKFHKVAIFGIVSGLAQIATSLLYIFWKRKSVRSFSIFFYVYFFIFLTHLTCMCIVLNSNHNRGSDKTKIFYKRQTSDIFCSFLGVNCLFLITCTIVTCVRCDSEEYSDNCLLDSEDTCNRTRSVGKTLNSGTTSTDRLNK